MFGFVLVPHGNLHIYLGYFFRVASQLGMLLASNPSCKTKSGTESLGSRLGCYTVAAVCIYSYTQGTIHFILMSLYHILFRQYIAAIATDFLTPVHWPITALKSNLIVLLPFIQNGQKAIDKFHALEAQCLWRTAPTGLYIYSTCGIPSLLMWKYIINTFLFMKILHCTSSWMQGQHK